MRHPLSTTLLLHRRLTVDNGAPLNGVLEVLAVVALAVAGAQNARLETLAVLLQTRRLFARAPLHVVFLRLPILTRLCLTSLQVGSLLTFAGCLRAWNRDLSGR